MVNGNLSLWLCSPLQIGAQSKEVRALYSICSFERVTYWNQGISLEAEACFPEFLALMTVGWRLCLLVPINYQSAQIWIPSWGMSLFFYLVVEMQANRMTSGQLACFSAFRAVAQLELGVLAMTLFLLSGRLSKEKLSVSG